MNKRKINVLRGTMFASHLDFVKVWHDLEDEVVDNDKSEEGLEYRAHMSKFKANVQKTLKGSLEN